MWERSIISLSKFFILSFNNGTCYILVLINMQPACHVTVTLYIYTLLHWQFQCHSNKKTDRSFTCKYLKKLSDILSTIFFHNVIDLHINNTQHVKHFLLNFCETHWWAVTDTKTSMLYITLSSGYTIWWRLCESLVKGSQFMTAAVPCTLRFSRQEIAVDCSHWFVFVVVRFRYVIVVVTFAQWAIRSLKVAHWRWSPTPTTFS